MLFWAFPRAIAQLADAATLRVLFVSVLLTLLLFAALCAGLIWLFQGIDVTSWPDWLARGWGFADVGFAILLAVGGLFFLFPAVATAVMSLFLDTIVDAVEARWYPGERATRSLGLGDNLRLGLGAAGRVLFWNLLALPLYLLLLFTAIGPLFLVAAINGWLLGRDYLEMVAARHLPRAALQPWVGARSMTRLTVGLTIAGLFLLPFVNLLAPLIGAALATHAFHAARTRGA